MGQSNDSSVLFSLQQLMSLEEDRIREEEAVRQRREADAARQMLEAERTLRERERARLRQLDEERESAERRAREEAARLEAIRLAEIERARLDVEKKARLELLERQQLHERELAQVAAQSGRKKLRAWLVALGVVAFVGIGGGAYALHVQTERKEAVAAQARALEQQVAELEGLKLKGRESGDQGAIEELNRRIRELEHARERLPQPPSKTPRTPSAPPPAAPAKAPAKPCTKVCLKGDPLCVGCL